MKRLALLAVVMLVAAACEPRGTDEQAVDTTAPAVAPAPADTLMDTMPRDTVR